jgi:branched-chain amino acid transport system permease protein
VLITGLAAGAGYGLVAIGYSLVYRLTGVVHFAMGELVNLAVFLTLWLAVGTGPVSRSNVPAGRFLGSLVVALVAVGVVGAAAYVLTIRPSVRSGSTMGWVGATVALTFVIRGLLAATFLRQSYVFPDPLPFSRLPHAGVLALGGGVTVPVRALFVIGAGALLAYLGGRLVTRSGPGLALQAVATDRLGARAAGLPVERLTMAAFALAGAFAGLAAVLEAPAAPVTVDTGALLGLKGLVAALVVGFGSPAASFAAGLGVGVLEAGVSALHVGGLRLGPEYRDVIPLALAILLVGLRRTREREAAP